MLFYSEGEVMQMGLTSYGEFLKENKLSTDARNTARVKEAGKKIAQAVETYFKSVGMENRIAGFQWEFNLVQSPEVNAWCMPGGKVVFYEGILPVCQTDAGIAVVMGHEIAHAIASHSNERMSQQMLVEAGSSAAAVLLKNKTEKTQQLWATAIGLGANYGVVLPFSRHQETEADRLGLIFMAIAGYDPHEAVAFWTRMAQASGGQNTPEFMSTHPSDEHRIIDLNKDLQEALQYYRP